MARQLLFARLKGALTSTSAPSPVSAGDDEVLVGDIRPDGHMRLYAFYTPALGGGEYTVSASQQVTAYRVSEAQSVPPIVNHRLIPSSGHPSTLVSEPTPQGFNVIAPQFSLNPKLINSYYPTAQDEGRVLPHIVFNDPHVPWLRDAGLTAWATKPIANLSGDGADWSGRTKVPWMALMVFDPADLVVDSTAAGLLGLSALECWMKATGKPPVNYSYDMTVAEFLGLKSRVAVDAFDPISDVQQATKVIFPKKQQVKDVFGQDPNSLTPLNALQMLSHVRHVNNKGLPDYDPTLTTYFSVLISSMSGDIKIQQPTTHIVHLVSIENLDSTFDPTRSNGISGPSERMALVSLFSWVYSCVPDSVDFATTMNALAASSQPLRPPDPVLDGMVSALPKDATPAQLSAANALFQRLKHGYTISRWRNAVGEVSMAFNRSPLVPKHLPSVVQPTTSGSAVTLPQPPTEDWPTYSMSGKNYQIFDRNVGMLDATYASAWSLGKLTAISDSTFIAALTRFRSRATTMAVSQTLLAVNGISNKRTVLAHAATSLSAATGLAAGGFKGDVARTRVPSSTTRPQTTIDSDVRSSLPKAIGAAVRIRGLSTAGAVHTGLDAEKPVDSDWETVSNWVHDALYLGHVPAFHLFPDPSFLREHLDPSTLPKDITKLHPEALRFFSVDGTWLDCFIDGALSSANHTDPQRDEVRLAIKKVINEALRTGGPSGTPIPVPVSGFVIRSAAIKATPDLRVTVTRWSFSNSQWTEDVQHDPLLRLTHLDDFTIFCLLDCGLDEVAKITLAQPPHHQRFAFSVNPDFDRDTGAYKSFTPEFKVRALYTNPGLAPEAAGEAGSWPELSPPYQLLPNDEQGFYNDATRCIAADAIVRKVVGKLSAWNQAADASKRPYTDSVPDSAVMGFELGDPAYQLEIEGVIPGSDTAFSHPPRQLWTGNDTTTSSLPAPNNTSTNQGLLKLIAAGQRPALPARVSLNRSAVVRHVLAAGAPTRKPNVAPPADMKDCQFELLVHPDYRQPPPRPKPPYKFDARALYSPQTQLPAAPISLYDLIFAVRRRPRHTEGKWQLKKITIEVPVQDGSDTKSASDIIWRDPLLAATDYAGRGLRMTGNHRFIPTLQSTLSSDDGKECLCITLVPRSGQAEGTMLLKDDGASAEGSVRLTDARLAPIVDTRRKVLIAQPNNAPAVSTSAGLCFVKMTEVYNSGQQNQQSWAVVLKTSMRDKDARGNEM
ncbi:hypothetical protein BAUCODRAFT_20505 [Baudoinia panamericana UAMH 10762]|uniref:Uncharacterized protein n=1 Tax=Baudoinia panamericana (strain UAMH 10762) TaxID=717646 RepID=M2NMH8_BAUPA|nr:uncharacterized protein BAUCODRAFT_20505 [Baudoinia panamericana UAMH 10762]EMD00391.1 hypothetical protein BAUCODRAFT_20505 [Baudoinia panamericana UAMH 10762]